MSALVGKTLGQYRIESEAGQGGMGVVYRAVDTRLDRPVAVKLLRHDIVADADRKRRFVQEAKAASALNHPGIVTIYQIGTQADVDFIAMEFVEGRSLDRVIDGRPLPLTDAVRYTIDIADALAAAHAAGIVHRDLKPSNVMVSLKNRIKLLDFGLAKLTGAPDTGDSALTVSVAPQTAVGMIMGTAAYMSPEQAAGLHVDARSDVFSLGVMLHEMITGRRPAPGTAVTEDIPREVRRIIRRCLEPDPARRFQVMDDVRMAVEDADLTGGPPATVVARRQRVPIIAALCALVAAAGLAAGWFLKPSRSAPPALLSRLTLDAGLTTDLALSPDGKFLAYASDRGGDGNLDIWVQQVAGGEPARLTADPASDIEPAFSPDGSRVAFRSDRDGGGIYVVSSFGGEAHRIVDGGRRPRWSPDGREIAYWVGQNTAFLISRADSPQAFVVAASGGVPRAIASDFAVAWLPVWSDDGRRLLFLGSRDSDTTPEWWIVPSGGGVPVQTRAHSMIRQQGLTPSPDSFFVPESWDADGTVLFSAGMGDSTNIWRVGVASDGRVKGLPERLTSGTGMEVSPTAVTDRLAFSVLTTTMDLWSLPVDTSSGRVTGEPERLMQDAATDAYPWFSPDGSKLIFLSNRSGTYDLWMRDMQQGKETVLASHVSFPDVPVISKDGARVFFNLAGQQPVYSLPLSGSRADLSVASELTCDDCHGVWDISADGRWALSPKAQDHVIVARDIVNGKITTFLDAGDEIVGRLRISPDDRWVVFSHRARGTIELVVTPFTPGVAIDRSRWIRLTTPETIPNAPAWSLDGRIVYYIGNGDGHFCVWAQTIDQVTGKPSGAPFAVWHFHDARRTIARIPLPLRAVAVSRDRIALNVVESSGSAWMATPLLVPPSSRSKP